MTIFSTFRVLVLKSELLNGVPEGILGTHCCLEWKKEQKGSKGTEAL